MAVNDLKALLLYHRLDGKTDSKGSKAELQIRAGLPADAATTDTAAYDGPSPPCAARGARCPPVLGFGTLESTTIVHRCALPAR